MAGRRPLRLQQRPDRPTAHDFTVALAGNPNTGKSCIFNGLTGLRQHVGNWAGKTVQRAVGRFDSGGRRFELVDLPGTYSLRATSVDEEVAREFITAGAPDCTIVVVDASALERNLNLLLQILELTPRVVVALNLVDEAARNGLRVEPGRLSAQLGVPVVPTIGNRGKGLDALAGAVRRVCLGEWPGRPARPRFDGAGDDAVLAAIYAEAERIAAACVRPIPGARGRADEWLDRLVCSRTVGFALMAALLALVFWLTVVGANRPSELLAGCLFGLEADLAALTDGLGAPWWLTGALVHGMFRALAWVVAVMLPPMAIFFPAFTLLEDIGYLPRVAFNLDRLFRSCGAHGKTALTHCMGFGCNAAGVTACRIIESPRERLIAILTNNFAPCNGRWPTLILLAAVFLAPAAGVAGPAAAALCLTGVTLLGFGCALLGSWLLSRTLLRGEASAFAFELPSYRRPRLLQVLYTSLIDRTLFVLGRAVAIAAPAGLAIWLAGNLMVGEQSLYDLVATWLEPLGHAIGLDGVILLAYLLAVPANEIVIPTMFMGYAVRSQADPGNHMLVDLAGAEPVRHLLESQGWTLLTAVCLVLFVLLHHPCSTTLITIYRETRSARWTAVAALLPLALGVLVCGLVAGVARLAGWV